MRDWWNRQTPYIIKLICEYGGMADTADFVDA